MKGRAALLAAGAVFLVALVLPAFISGYGIRILNLALISAIAVIGLNFAFGYAGLITLAQAGFVGCGAVAARGRGAIAVPVVRGRGHGDVLLFFGDGGAESSTGQALRS